MTRMTPAAASRDAAVRIERTFEFPRDVVFDAWVRPEMLARWYAPRGCTIRFVSIDVRPGGRFHACIQNPSFGECWTIGTYRDVRRPDRLVFTSAIADAAGNPATPSSQGHDPDWPAETLITVTFTESGGRTTVTLEQTVSETLARRTGAFPSWLEMLDRLAEALRDRR